MKKKILNIINTVLLSIIISLSASRTCYADVDVNALQGYLNGVVAQQQIHQTNNPKYAERNNASETIDPVTGNLMLKQTDLCLPGKDGLDLSICRIYNSSQDEFTSKVSITQTETPSTYTSISGYVNDVMVYDTTSNSYSSMTCGPYQDSYTAYCAYQAMNGYNYNGKIFYPYQTRAITTTYTSTSYSIVKTEYTDHDYNTYRYYLGAGWSFSFPSVQIENGYGSQYIYYHDGSGATYRVLNTLDTGQSNLEGYQGNDVKFIGDGGTFVNEDSIPSKYKFISADKKTAYFAADGRLLGIKDRYNNVIRFRYTSITIFGSSTPVISEITDSIGRVVTFTYAGTDINLQVKAPNETNTLSIKYSRSFANVQSYYNNNILTNYNFPTLESVTDPLNRETKYINYYNFNNNSWPSESFSYSTKNVTGLNTRNRYLLGAIVYPGSKTLYKYEKVTRNLGSDGAIENYRIKSRHDEVQRKNTNTNIMEWITNNNEDYSYSGDYTGYPTYTSEEVIPNTYQFWSQSTNNCGMTVQTAFNGNKQEIWVSNTASNNEKEIMNIEEYNNNYKYLPIRLLYTEETGDGAITHQYHKYINYTQWGGISSSTLPITSDQYNNDSDLYTTTYSYNDTTDQNLLTNTQYHQSKSKLLSDSYGYDSMGRVVSYTNANGEVINYNYSNDSNGNKIEERTQKIEDGKIAKTILVYGSETGYAYPKEIKQYYTDSQGNYKETKISRTYNMLLGLVKTETDNDNKTTKYEYDSLGRITSITYPDFTNSAGESYTKKQEYEYLEGYNNEYSDGNYTGIYGTTVISRTIYINKSNGITCYYNQCKSLYDAYGNLRQEKLFDGSSSTDVLKSKYTYDNIQRVISSIDADGNTITQSYDPWGQVNEVTDNAGNLYVNQKELKNSRIINYFVSKDNIASYRANTSANTYKEDYIEYYIDQFGRTTERRVYENWPTISGALSELYTYDNVGNLIGYTDPKRNLNQDQLYTTSYYYDNLNRISLVKDALNQITRVGYTIRGNVKSVMMQDRLDSTNSITLYTKSYDEMGNNTNKWDPSSLVTSYSFNSIGLCSKTVDRNGSSLTATYDEQNNIKETIQTSADNSSSIKREYNYNNPFGYNYEKLYNNGSFATMNSYTYNASGKIIQKNTTGGNYLNSNLKLQYDNCGRLTSVGSGVKDTNYFYTNYKYSNNRLSQIQTNGLQANSTSDNDNATYEYFPDGKLKKIIYPKLNDNSYLTTEYTYNALSRLTSIINKKGNMVLSQFSYTYDANGNIISVNDGQTTKTYVYDKLNRLIEIHPKSGNSISYTYDLRGNRITLSNGGYNFNIISTIYSYDLENKLKSVKKGTAATDMFYDVDGLRAKKQTSSGTTSYIYNLSGQLIAESTNTTNVTTNYIWASDRVLAKKDVGGGEYYYLYNGHGDVVQMVDKNGNVVNNYEYDEWGNITTNNETVSNPFKYAGYIYDQETGLYYLKARYYDPKMGRFLNEDPYWNNQNTIFEDNQNNDPVSNNQAIMQSTNLYTYCMNNSLLFIDPSGEDAIYMVDSNGAAGAGHGALAIQDSDGKWWIMSYQPVGTNSILGIKVPNVGVVFCELKNIKFADDGKSILSANYTYKGTKATVKGNVSAYDSQVYIKGDFTKSCDMASKYEKNPPGYWLTSSNCAWLAIKVLQASTKGKTYRKLDSILWYDDFLFGKRRNTIIPNLSTGWVREAMKGKYSVNTTVIR